MTEKITGYCLLAFGVFLILGSALSVYRVFTNQTKPLAVFNFEPISLDLGQPQIPKTQIVPAAMLNDTANLAAHLFLMGFIASVGQKLASLGVQLLRPIEIKLSEGQKSKLNL
jgi:hypothetical protein